MNRLTRSLRGARYALVLLLAQGALADSLAPGNALVEAPVEAPVEEYGAPIALRQPTPLAEVLNSPERFAEQPVLLQGRITDVCQKKGCWTVLAEGQAFVRIRFQDYAFFVPTDVTGRRAYAEGLVSVETLSESEARHYAEESKDGDPDAIEGPQRVVSFTASGIRILAAEGSGS
ncbi:MAG: DUF4920 domain-containing protein [Myxococcota bacterium]|nr:DUF4920 domain-containing protein [Myxococcota bacterium]